MGRTVLAGDLLRHELEHFGSMSSWESVIEWMQYWRDRNEISFSSVTKFSLTRMERAFFAGPFCS